MDLKRLFTFLLIVTVTFSVIVVAGWYSPNFNIKDHTKLGLDLKGGFEILYEASEFDPNKKVSRDSLVQAASFLEQKVNIYGVSEPEILIEGENRIRVRLAGVQNAEEVRQQIGKPAKLTFRSDDGKKIELIGTDFVESGARLDYDQQGQPVVAIKLIDAAKFGEITARLTGKILSIYMDEDLISAPVVNEPITGGEAVISGQGSAAEAKQLADTINLGASPLALKEIYVQSVGATLGQTAFEQTVQAAIWASILICIFMIFYYRVPGVIASITIITYIWLLITTMNLMSVTLTLPGIAAFVLAVGMAVDSNIITFERLKEEILVGKSLNSALRAGSKTSFTTIMDANITTIIAAAVLYWLGTGAIQGFALTLIVCITLSIVTNVFFSRLLLYYLIRSQVITNPVYYGVKGSEIRAL